LKYLCSFRRCEELNRVEGLFNTVGALVEEGEGVGGGLGVGDLAGQKSS
jgi:hypothetical protein